MKAATSTVPATLGRSGFRSAGERDRYRNQNKNS
jgi:hypothetical protein